MIAGPLTLIAQKINYKSGILQVDEKDVAKVVKIKDKENYGLTSTYELYSLGGEKLALATIATDFKADRGDNTSYYYRVTFLTVNQVGIFSLSKLGPEKSFAKLIGEGGIVVNDQLDSRFVTELIARRGRTPVVQAEYVLIKRNRLFPIVFKDNDIYQDDVLIGQFKDISSRREFDTYEFSIVTGLVAARVNYTGGNGAKNFTVSTTESNSTQNISIKSNGMTYGKLLLRSEGMDRNDIVLKRIAKWLVDEEYL